MNYTYNAILLDMHELVVRRGGQHDHGLDGLRLVVEHHHAQPHLFALAAAVRALHLDEERQHAHVLPTHSLISILDPAFWQVLGSCCQRNDIRESLV